MDSTEESGIVSDMGKYAKAKSTNTDSITLTLEEKARKLKQNTRTEGQKRRTATKHKQMARGRFLSATTHRAFTSMKQKVFFPATGEKAPSLLLIVMHAYYPSFPLKLCLVSLHFFTRGNKFSSLWCLLSVPVPGGGVSHSIWLACLNRPADADGALIDFVVQDLK